MAFLQRHDRHRPIMASEDNDQMTGSYIMVDPHGRLYQNRDDGNSTGYQYSKPITEVGAQEAFGQVAFARDRYAARYSVVSISGNPIRESGEAVVTA